jgi:hypothetical protein
MGGTFAPCMIRLASSLIVPRFIMEWTLPKQNFPQIVGISCYHIMFFPQMQAAWNSTNLLLSLETNFHITCQIHKKIIKNAKNFFTPRINGSMIDGCKFPMPAKNLYI